MSGSGITPTMPGAAQSPAPKGQVVQIVSLPEGLKNNTRAIRIEGEVIAQNKDGSVRIKTDQGEINVQVRGKQPQAGAKIEVDIPAGNPPKTATIRPAPVPLPTMPLPQTPPPVTTQPAPNIPLPQTPVVQQPATPVQTNPAPIDPDTPVVTKPTTPLPAPENPAGVQAPKPVPTTLPPLSVGQTVQLAPLTEAPEGNLPQAVAPDTLPDDAANTVITKTTAQATMAAQKIQTGLIGNLLQAVKSVLPASPALAAQPATIAMPPDALIPAPSAQQTVLPPSLAQSSSVILGAKILSILPPLDQRIFMPQTPAGQTPVTMMPASPADTAPVTVPVISVAVTETTPQNKPVISLPMNNSGAVQNFVLQASASTAPPGTQITLMPQILPSTVIGTQVTNTPGLPSAQITSMPAAWRALMPLMQPSSIWPVMDDVFQTFYQTTPQAAQILGRIIPSPANGANFGPALMLFAAALKSGDMQSWLGEKKLEMIQKLGKEGLVSRLSSESASLSQSADAATTDWKSYPIPLLYQNEISKVLFHVRQEPDEQNNEGEGKATRFVMDVSLNRMGDVQLDALVRGKRVDLVVRTELPISHSMQDAMRTAYATALDNTDIYGDIGFQSDVKNFISVLGREEALASA
jgi:hypothetical protein